MELDGEYIKTLDVIIDCIPTLTLKNIKKLACSQVFLTESVHTLNFVEEITLVCKI